LVCHKEKYDELLEQEKILSCGFKLNEDKIKEGEGQPELASAADAAAEKNDLAPPEENQPEDLENAFLKKDEETAAAKDIKIPDEAQHIDEAKVKSANLKELVAKGLEQS
jgi:hypothetical protein